MVVSILPYHHEVRNTRRSGLQKQLPPIYPWSASLRWNT